ncbi:MAG: ribonuclease Z, partial [Candidatus Diapherotrites archaeon]|nr:ribonuclease Z [Candidatus Diapherotrites archaeon]
FDTCFVDSYLPAIQNSDLLIHECTFSDELQKKAKEVRHCTSTDAANAAKLSTSKKLVLNHISAREKEEDKLLQEAKKVFTNTVVGKDLQEFEV